MENDEQDKLKTKVENWLKKQGYPLEMEVASDFQKAGFSVSQSDYYRDSETNKLREIDITALKWSNFNNPVPIQVCARIECKLINKPWVVFVSQTQPEDSFYYGLLASKIYLNFLSKTLKDKSFHLSLNEATLLQNDYIGYGITQALTEGKDLPYQAVMSSVKASLDRVNKFNDTALHKFGNSLATIVFPTIVIDGALFEASYNPAGDVNTERVESSTLRWKGTNGSSPLVYIISKPALPDFINDFSEVCDKFIKLSEEYMNTLSLEADIYRQKLMVGQ